MSHGTSNHLQLLKYSQHFESLKVQEPVFTLVCVLSGKKCCTVRVAVIIGKNYFTLF